VSKLKKVNKEEQISKAEQVVKAIEFIKPRVTGVKKIFQKVGTQDLIKFRAATKKHPLEETNSDQAEDSNLRYLETHHSLINQAKQDPRFGEAEVKDPSWSKEKIRMINQMDLQLETRLGKYTRDQKVADRVFKGDP
jgi:ribonuclease BN (tRNA processing enzyme)